LIKVVPLEVKRVYLETGSVEVTRHQFGIGYRECAQILRHQGLEPKPQQPARKAALKRCARCGVRKPLMEFSKCTKSQDGRQSYCRSCAVEAKAGKLGGPCTRSPRRKAANPQVDAWGRKPKISQERQERVKLERQVKAGGPRGDQAAEELYKRYRVTYPGKNGAVVMIEVVGDLWDQPGWRVVTTSGSVRKDGAAVMGRGVALEARKLFPRLPFQLGIKIRREGNRVFPFPEYRLVTFPVKRYWYEKADLHLIRQSCVELKVLSRLLSPQMNVYMVRPGCGNGGLSWGVVKPVLEEVFQGLDFIVLVERG